MGLLDKLIGKRRNRDRRDWSQFETVSEKSPMVIEWRKGIYEQQLVRSVIERIALSFSKLEPVVYGTARPRVRRAIETSPSQYQTWSQFLHRCATLYYSDDNLYVIPVFKDGTSDVVTGFYPVRSVATKLMECDGELWVRFCTPAGNPVAMEFKNVAIITRFQYESDFFGSPNNLDGTLALLEAQADAQKQAIKDTGAVRWMGKVTGQMREEDIKDKRERFFKDNLDADSNKTGLMLYDNTYDSMTQIDPKNWTIPTQEMERIENGVFDYFGINRKILQNDYDETLWDAFYEGLIEPLAIQLGEALSQMVYTMRERPANRIEFSANRMAYASASTKRNMAKDMTDRAIMTRDEVRAMLQLPKIEGGDAFILRGEYKVGRTLEEIERAQRAQAASSGVASDLKDIDPRDADLDRGDGENYGNGGDTDTSDVTTTKQDRWD